MEAKGLQEPVNVGRHPRSVVTTVIGLIAPVIEWSPGMRHLGWG